MGAGRTGAKRVPARPPVAVVPDLRGLDTVEAAELASRASLQAVGPKGTPGSLRELAGVVARQRPEPGVVVRQHADVMVWTSGPGGDAGVREPLRPVPPARDGEAAESPAL